MTLEKYHSKFGIVKYLLPSYFFKMIFDYMKELENLIFFRNQIRKIDEDGLAKRKNWNIVNGGKRLSFAVNLMPENLISLDKTSLDEYERGALSREVLNVQNELVPYELYDITKFKYERILTKDYYAYGITCDFLFRKINRRNTIYLFIYVLSIVLLTLFFIYK